MDTIECIRTRMSIRKFKPDSVPKEMLMNLIDIAKWSPSYKNSQPWEAAVVSGAKKKELSNLLINLLEKETKPAPDLPEPMSWPPEIDERIREHLRKRSERFGIDLNDPEVIRRIKIANFKFYGAPHGIFIFQDLSLTQWSIFDVGMFTQNLMLAAHAYGLGTVPQAFLIDYSPEIKKFLQISESKKLILGVSIGYPDYNDKANSYRSNRVDADEILKWIE